MSLRRRFMVGPLRCYSQTGEQESDSESDSDDNDITSLHLRQSRRQISADVLHNFPPERHRKLALAGILVSEFFRNMAIQTVTVWIPITLSLNVHFFTNSDGEIDRKSHQHLKFMLGLVPVISSVLIYGLGWLVGLVTDSCLKKSRILTVTTFLMYAGFMYLCIVLYDTSNHIMCTSHNHTQDLSLVNCSISPVPTAGNLEATGVTGVIIVITLCIAVLESVFVTVLPVHGGDQIPELITVRRFYALYYWFRKVGEVITCLVCVAFVVLLPEKVFFQNDDYDGFYKALTRGWFGFAFATSTLATLFMLLVLFGKVTREPRSDVNVITDTAGIWKQACLRRKYRGEDNSCLDMAKISRDGGYPDEAVNERRSMALFFCVVLFLLPIGFTTKLPVSSIPSYKRVPASSIQGNHSTGDDYIYTERMECQTTIYCKLGIYVASALTIPLVHYLCIFLHQYYQIYIRFLHRIVAGHGMMVLCMSVYLITTHVYNYEISIRVLLAPSILLGITNALVYTAVYEMNMVIAPRSMQSTSMGMFRFLDGAGSLINLAAIYSSYAPPNVDYYLGCGIAAIFVGAILLILLERNVGVGLTRG